MPVGHDSAVRWETVSGCQTLTKVVVSTATRLLLPQGSPEMAPLHIVLAAGQHSSGRSAAVCFLLDEASVVGGRRSGRWSHCSLSSDWLCRTGAQRRCDRVCRVSWWFPPEKKGSGHFWVRVRVEFQDCVQETRLSAVRSLDSRQKCFPEFNTSSVI